MPLAGEWTFAPGDDARWRDPALDDRLWPTVRVPGPWEASGFEGRDGFAWLRRRFRRPAGRRGDLYLYLGCVADVDATYVNGIEVGATGRFPPRPVPRPDRERWYRLPAGLLRDENVIAVRVFDAGGPGGILEGPAAIRLGLAGRGPAILAGEELAARRGCLPGLDGRPGPGEALPAREPLPVPAGAARTASLRPRREGGIRLDAAGRAEEIACVRGAQARYAEERGRGEVACPPAVLFRSIRWTLREAESGRPIRLARLDAARFGFGIRRERASGTSGAHVAETIFAPASRPAILQLLDVDVDPPRPIELVLALEPAISVPPAPPERASLRWDAGRGALVAAAPDGRWAGVVDANVAWRPLAGGVPLPGDPTLRLAARLDPQAIEAGRIAVAWAGSDRGAEEALALAGYLLSDPGRAYRAALRVHEAAARPALASGGAERDDAFAWARTGVLSAFIRVPHVGGLYVPWEGSYAEAAREGLRLEDALWIARAALRLGDGARARGLLAALLRGGTPGIPARLVPGAALEPSPHLRTSALLVSTLREYLGWTGDRAFLAANRDRFEALAAWVLRADADGDGIPDAGGGVTSIEDAGLRAGALRAAAEVAAALDGDGGDWLRAAGEARAAIAERFWLADRARGAAERPAISGGLLAGGTPTGRVGGAVAMALLSGAMDDRRVDATLAALSCGDLLADWGVRSLSSADPAYDPGRPGRGAVTAFETGLGAVAALRGERPWLGATLLEALARWPRIFTPGSWPDALDGNVCARARGGRDAVLGAAAYVLAVVDGLLGIEARAEAGEVRIAPARVRHTGFLALSGLRIGPWAGSIAVRFGERSTRVSLDPRRPAAMRAIAEIPVPPQHTSRRVIARGRRELGDLRRSGRGARLVFAAPIEGGLTIRAPLEGAPQPLPAEPAFEPLSVSRATRLLGAIPFGRDELRIEIESDEGEGIFRLWSAVRPRASKGAEVRWLGERLYEVRVPIPRGGRRATVTLTIG